jgi:hypothetical protein
MQFTSLKKNLRRKNFSINMLEHKVTGYGYVLRLNKDRITKKVMNAELEGKCRRGNQDGNGSLGKMVQ